MRSSATPTNFVLEMLAQNSGLKGALLSITAIATNAKIAKAVENAGAGYLPAVKASQPSLRARRTNAACSGSFVDHGKGHDRVEEQTVSVIKEIYWLDWIGRVFAASFRCPAPPASYGSGRAPKGPAVANSRRASTFSRPCADMRTLRTAAHCPSRGETDVSAQGRAGGEAALVMDRRRHCNRNNGGA